MRVSCEEGGGWCLLLPGFLARTKSNSRVLPTSSRGKFFGYLANSRLFFFAPKWGWDLPFNLIQTKHCSTIDGPTPPSRHLGNTLLGLGGDLLECLDKRDESLAAHKWLQHLRHVHARLGLVILDEAAQGPAGIETRVWDLVFKIQGMGYGDWAAQGPSGSRRGFGI